MESLRAVTTPLRDQGHRIAELVLDLSRTTGDDLVPFALDTFGRFDAVVNTAAVYQPSAATALDPAQWSETMDANLRGPLLVTSSAARHFVRQGSGRIVHIASITALVSRGGYTLYEVSKAGLVAATRSMAVELAPHGVVVNSVAPGWVRTPMSEQFLAGCSPAAIADLIPVGRVGEPDEIAQVTCWLATESPGFLTGQTIVVDGGQISRTAHL
jgi:NAD(P)-dependent dehydrogenase (short-subunit alcohol dehydrogenase family)